MDTIIAYHKNLYERYSKLPKRRRTEKRTAAVNKVKELIEEIMKTNRNGIRMQITTILSETESDEGDVDALFKDYETLCKSIEFAKVKRDSESSGIETGESESEASTSAAGGGEPAPKSDPDDCDVTLQLAQDECKSMEVRFRSATQTISTLREQIQALNKRIEGQIKVIEGQNKVIEGQNKVIEGQNKRIEEQDKRIRQLEPDSDLVARYDIVYQLSRELTSAAGDDVVRISHLKRDDFVEKYPGAKSIVDEVDKEFDSRRRFLDVTKRMMDDRSGIGHLTAEECSETYDVAKLSEVCQTNEERATLRILMKQPGRGSRFPLAKK